MLRIGNPLRGDDAIGHLLAKELEPLNDEGFQAHAVGTAVENVMRWIRESASAMILLVDAVFDESPAEGSWTLYTYKRFVVATFYNPLLKINNLENQYSPSSGSRAKLPS